MKDIQRHKVLKDVIDKRLTGVAAAELLGLTPVHVCRLKHRLLRDGFEGLLRQASAQSVYNKIPSSVIDQIVNLRREIYYDLNVLHFKDKLAELHNLSYSYEALRKILITHGLHQTKKRRRVFRQRRRMPKAGMLVQMDSSEHQWLAHIPAKWWLVAMIDDASNEIPCAELYPQDSVFANMEVLRGTIETKGLFMALYVDKASHFTTTRQGGLHYQVALEQNDTQIERALGELGINLILANSPQAKGRIEVVFRLFQDRFIKEMRLAGIKTYEQANHYLKHTFLPWYNRRYTRPAESVYMPLPKDKNLDLIFCIKHQRRVGRDNTIQLDGQTIQIPPSRIQLCFTQKKVDVCVLEDQRIFVVYNNQVIAESRVSPEQHRLNQAVTAAKLLAQRTSEPVQPRLRLRVRKPPPANHPWRKSFLSRPKPIPNPHAQH
jgi:hypothetical protein